MSGGGVEVLREALIEEERRLDAAERAREAGRVREAVLRDAAAPARIERLRVEDAPAAADDGLLVEGVDRAQPRREAAVPILFRIARAVAGGAVAVAGKGEASRTSARAGVGADRIEEREAVVLLGRGRVVVPAQAVVERQLAVDPPGVAGVEDPGASAADSDESTARKSTLPLSTAPSRKLAIGLPLLTPEQAGGAAREVEGARPGCRWCGGSP